MKLVPVGALAGPRPLGLLAGKVQESPDCWESDPELEQSFYGVGEASELRVAETPPRP